MGQAQQSTAPVSDFSCQGGKSDNHNLELPDTFRDQRISLQKPKLDDDGEAPPRMDRTSGV